MKKSSIIGSTKKVAKPILLFIPFILIIILLTITFTVFFTQKKSQAPEESEASSYMSECSNVKVTNIDNNKYALKANINIPSNPQIKRIIYYYRNYSNNPICEDDTNPWKKIEETTNLDDPTIEWDTTNLKAGKYRIVANTMYHKTDWVPGCSGNPACIGMDKNKCSNCAGSFSICRKCNTTITIDNNISNDTTNNPKAIAIIIDPILENYGNISLSKYKGWNNPNILLEQIKSGISESTNGMINYEIEEIIIQNTFPMKIDSFQYTEESYLNCMGRNGETTNVNACHIPDTISYNKIFSDYNLCEKIQKNNINDIWILGAPYFGGDEYAMRIPNDTPKNISGCYKGGPSGYYRPYDIPDCGSSIFVMTYNYERDIAEALHSYGHRIEGTMNIVMSECKWDRNLYGKDPWNTFTYYTLDNLKTGQNINCGNIHFPPNGIKDYDYENKNLVLSYCDNWLNQIYDGYEEINGKLINCEEWNCTQLGYMKYWLNHIPRFEGTTNNYQNNWWKYILEFDKYFDLEPITTISSFSSEYSKGWANRIMDGIHGTCNTGEWATNNSPSGWVKIDTPKGVNNISIYDRACAEQVLSGHIELDTGIEIPFGKLENSGNIPTSVEVNKNTKWIKIHIDSSQGHNPGFSEIVIEPINQY